MALPSSRAPNGTRRKILIGGHEYFAKGLVRRLADFDKANSYAYLEPVASFADKVRRAITIVNSDVLYFIGGTVRRNRLIDLALFFRRPIVIHWAGTDVLAAREDSLANRADKSFVARATHWCEVRWIRDELKEIGIDAQVVAIAALDGDSTVASRLPARFSVLSYVREGREAFYGMDDLVQLAEDFPEIEVRIAGISRYSSSLPENVKLLGWKEDMRDEYRNAVLYLRLPEHDGLAFSVLEALSYGRYVGYSYEYPHTLLIDCYARLKDAARELIDSFHAGSLGVNAAGADFVRRHFDSATVLAALVKRLGRAQVVRVP